MSNVHLTIGGRGYTVACASGEEAHVAQLGGIIDARVTAGGLRGQGEVRMMLFAALMLADELHEAQQALAAAAAAPSAMDEAAVQANARVEQRIDDIAHRLEALAQRLEERAATP